MRRTRGDSGRFRFFLLAVRVCPVPAFWPAPVWPPTLLAGLAGLDDPAGAAFWAGAFAGAD